MIRVTYGSSCKPTQLGGMCERPEGVGPNDAGQNMVREALGASSEGEY